MTDSQNEKISFRRLKHDLRTQVNHIIGYSEMILEDAQDQLPEEILDLLKQNQTQGRQLVLSLNDFFESLTAGVQRQDIERSIAKLRDQMDRISTSVRAVFQQIPADSRKEYLPDLEKIKSAVSNWRRMLDENVAGEDILEWIQHSEKDSEAPTAHWMKPPEEWGGAPEGVLHGKVLVVDDDESNREILTRRLKAHQFEVEHAADGESALEKVQAADYDLILLDVLMPGKNGYEVLQEIKADPALRHIPIIMISAMDEIDGIVRCIESGAEDYLAKPFNPVFLRARVGAVLEKKRLRDQEQVFLDRLKISETNYKTLLENSVDGIVVLDLLGNVRFVNPAAETLFGRRRDQFEGNMFDFGIVPGESRETCIQQGKKQIIAELRAVHTHWEGKSACLAIFRDITQQKLNEKKIQEQQQKLEEANQRLSELATQDGLTGLKNHRAFKERIKGEIYKAKRYRYPLSLMMLDVDKFKQYNDDFGHPAGDEVLKQVAQVLTYNARETDLIARYGGEEFVVLLPHTSKKDALTVAERMRHSIESGQWEHRPVTASFGVASVHQGVKNSDDLIEQADRALYESKRKGRNRVTHAFDLIIF